MNAFEDNKKLFMYFYNKIYVNKVKYFKSIKVFKKTVSNLINEPHNLPYESETNKTTVNKTTVKVKNKKMEITSNKYLSKSLSL